MTETPIEKLKAIMVALRDPKTGCPWDTKQTFATIAPYTIEEAYEVDDAIARADMADLKDELGDLLFQVIFHARMAEEAGAFDFDDVVEGLCEKMTRRHPHVFAGGDASDEAAVNAEWEAIKSAERAAKAAAEGRSPSVLDGVAAGLPALAKAQKIQKRAARLGFDWEQASQVWEKIREEEAELMAEIDSSEQNESNAQRIAEEFGDILFGYVNLARFLNLDAESALRGCNHRFDARFRRMEHLAQEQSLVMADMDIVGLEALWQEAKAQLRQEVA